MQQPKLIDRIRYAFDNSMTRGPIALLGWLTVTSIVVIVIIALIVSVAGAMPEGVGPMGDNTQPDFIQTVWMGLMRTLDAGTMGGDKGPWPFLIGMLAFTVVGVVVVSALIGIINNGIEDKLDQLRKGRSFVLEQQHTLILGWSPKIFTILSELVIANANQAKPRIVILADKDKVEMEDEIRDKVSSTGKTRIICRTGNPLELGDLEIVNPHTARSIIILAPESGDPDSEVIKMILALTNNPNRRTAPYHIVAELSDSKNLDVARMVGRDEAELIVSRDLISRIVVQTARQSGLLSFQ
jgi:ion channel POLLUX/CASTOR